MAKQAGPETLRIESWTGTDTNDETKIRLTDLKNLHNAKLTSERYLTRRLGCVEVYAGLTGSIQAVMEYTPPSGTRYILAVAGSKLYQWSTTTLTWSLMVDITLNIETTTPVRSLEHNGYLYFGNKVVYKVGPQAKIVCPYKVLAGSVYQANISTGALETLSLADYELPVDSTAFYHHSDEVKFSVKNSSTDLYVYVSIKGKLTHAIHNKADLSGITSFNAVNSADFIYFIFCYGMQVQIMKFDKSEYTLIKTSAVAMTWANLISNPVYFLGSSIKTFSYLEGKIYCTVERWGYYSSGPTGPQNPVGSYHETRMVSITCSTIIEAAAYTYTTEHSALTGIPTDYAAPIVLSHYIPFIVYNSTTKALAWIRRWAPGNGPPSCTIYASYGGVQTSASTSFLFNVDDFLKITTPFVYCDHADLSNIANYATKLHFGVLSLTTSQLTLWTYPNNYSFNRIIALNTASLSGSRYRGIELDASENSAIALMGLNTGHSFKDTTSTSSTLLTKSSTDMLRTLANRSTANFGLGVFMTPGEYAEINDIMYESWAIAGLTSQASCLPPPASVVLTDQTVYGIGGYVLCSFTQQQYNYQVLDWGMFELHQGRIFGLDPGDLLTLLWTDAFTDELSVDSYEPISRAVTGLKSANNRLYFFSRGSAHAIDGIMGQHSITEVDGKKGCVSADTIQASDNTLFFLSIQGPCIISGNQLVGIYDQLWPKYFDPTSPDCINFAAIETSRALIDPENKEYKLWIPSHGSLVPDLCLCYDWEKRYWHTEDFTDGSYPYCMARFADSDGIEQFLIGSSVDKILKMNTGNHDNFKAIDWTIESGKISTSQFQQIVRKMVLQARAHTELLVEYRSDDQDYIPDRIVQGPETVITNHPVRVMNGRGQYFQYKLRGKDIGAEPPVIRRIDLEIYPTSSRGMAYD